MFWQHYGSLPSNLFILVLELLNAAIKNDPEITWVKINDSEYLLSQYANDSSP
jgi:hypothetical protein